MSARRLVLAASCASLVCAAALLAARSSSSALAAPAPVVAAPAPKPRPAPVAVAAPPKCGDAVAKQGGSEGDPKVRAAAQKGLSFLARSSREWTRDHNCFGCHVQAVTMEALAAGRHHQYDVPDRDVDAMVKALQLGVTAGGRVTGAAFEGAAWARYDRWVDERQTKELLRYARELVGLQARSGAIPDDDARLPITGGTMQTTYQAAQAWRQAFARTADEKWLAPLRRAEAFLSSTSRAWTPESRGVYLQDVNFALLGLVSSGVGRGEESSDRLQKLLLSRQRDDGGWSLDGGKSDAFATGQTMYALKLAGWSDADPAIARAMRWLVSHQDASGAWRTYRSEQGGVEKAETMWGVLGLVTVDVVSVAVTGLVDGERLRPTMEIIAQAADNQGGGVTQLELLVDDVLVHRACGAKLAHAWKTAGLAPGRHVVDVVATNAKGQESRRRFEAYAGDVFLTNVGAHFDEAAQRTRVTFRHLAPADGAAGSVAFEVLELADGGKPGAPVYATQAPAVPGAMEFAWEGRGDDGRLRPRGRYFARVAFRAADGRLAQAESTVFFHDSEAVQRKTFGEIEGQLSMKGGSVGSANTVVELVDAAGRVVQSTRTTEQGNYRFKNVDEGQYRVRARKDGFAALEAPVAAAPAAEAAKASMSW